MGHLHPDLNHNKFWHKILLNIYSHFPILTLKVYNFSAKFSKLPLAGPLVRKFMFWYGANLKGGQILTLQEAIDLVNKSTQCSLGECPCRTYLYPGKCSHTTWCCVRINYSAEIFTNKKTEKHQLIEKEKLIELLKINSEKENLFYNAVYCVNPNIYALCGCCRNCIAYKMYKDYEIKSVLKPGHYIAQVKSELCKLCGECEKKCYFDAICNGQIDSEKCMGCGLCLWACNFNAIEMVKRLEEN